MKLVARIKLYCLKIGKHKSPTEVVIEALRKHIQYRKQLQISALFGTIDYDETHNYKEQRQRP